MAQGLYRSTQNRKLAEFLSRDFEQEVHRQAAQVGGVGHFCQSFLLQVVGLRDFLSGWHIVFMPLATPFSNGLVTHPASLSANGCRKMRLCCWASTGTSWRPPFSSWVSASVGSYMMSLHYSQMSLSNHLQL